MRTVLASLTLPKSKVVKLKFDGVLDSTVEENLYANIVKYLINQNLLHIEQVEHSPKNFEGEPSIEFIGRLNVSKFEPIKNSQQNYDSFNQFVKKLYN